MSSTSGIYEGCGETSDAGEEGDESGENAQQDGEADEDDMDLDDDMVWELRGACLA